MKGKAASVGTIINNQVSERMNNENSIDNINDYHDDEYV